MMKWKKYCTCFFMSSFMVTVGATSYATMNDFKPAFYEDEKLEVEVMKQDELFQELEQSDEFLQEKDYLDKEDDTSQKETKKKSNQEVQTLKQDKKKEKKKRIDVNVRGLNEKDSVEIFINAGRDDELCRLKKKQETFYVEGDSKIITLVDKAGQVYQVHQEEDQVEVSIHLDMDGNFQFADVNVLFQTPYPLSEAYQDPASCYLGKDGTSQIKLYDEHNNVIADCIIHPDVQFYNDMQGNLGWVETKQPVFLFQGENYRMEYLEEPVLVSNGYIEEYEERLDFVYDDTFFLANNNHVIKTGVYPRVNQTLTVEHVNGTPITNQKLCFYHDPLCLDPIQRIDGSFVEYRTDENGKAQLAGVFDGGWEPTMHPDGYKMSESSLSQYLDLFEITSIRKNIYVDMPEADELEFVNHQLELCNYRVDREEKISVKLDFRFPTLEEPMWLKVDEVSEIEVPNTADHYNPKGHLRILTISYFILMFSLVMLKTRRKPRH